LWSNACLLPELVQPMGGGYLSGQFFLMVPSFQYVIQDPICSVLLKKAGGYCSFPPITSKLSMFVKKFINCI